MEPAMLLLLLFAAEHSAEPASAESAALKGLGPVFKTKPEKPFLQPTLCAVCRATYGAQG